MMQKLRIICAIAVLAMATASCCPCGLLLDSSEQDQASQTEETSENQGTQTEKPQ